MLTRDDLIDLIVRHLIEAAPSLGLSKDKRRDESALRQGLSKGQPFSDRKKRVFLSEYEINKRVDIKNRRLVVPQEAILSPLAMDGLILRGIEIVRE